MKEMTAPDIAGRWPAANHRFLQTELKRLRLLLRRRVLWLRQQWARRGAPGYQGLVIGEVQADQLLAGEDRRAELCFYEQNGQARAIAKSIATVERELEEQRLAFMSAGLPPSLDALAQAFELTEFERSVVLLCLAPEVDASFERLYAYVQDDATRKYVTPELALALFGGEGDDWLQARSSLLPEATLRYLYLLAPAGGPAPTTLPGARPLHLDERVVSFLLGVNRLDRRVAEWLSVLPSLTYSDAREERVKQLHQRLLAEAEAGPLPAVNLIGPPGAGEYALARGLCERMGLQLYGLNVARLPASGGERHDAFRLLEREALLSRFALYLETTKSETGEAVPPNSAGDVVDNLGVFLILSSPEKWHSAARRSVTLRLEKPDVCARRSIWQKALTTVNQTLNGELESLVQQFDFDPTAISQVIAAARGQADARASDGRGTLTAADLWQACREQSGWRLDEMAQRITPCNTWEDIVLPDDVFEQLQEIARQVANRAQVYEKWGFGAKLSRGRGISALFSGPSGTGKTMAAEILAHHLNLHLYRIDLSGVVSKYIGETEKNLRRVFDAAEQSGAILFFDEADALFGKRTEVKDSHDRYANIEVNYLLQRMEDYRGLAILATNMKSHLDDAFLRRLRFVVDFPFPDVKQRAHIWRKVFPREAALAELDYNALARQEIPGGNIKNIALNAAFLAAAAQEPIGMEHVLRAARREYTKINKLVLEAEFGSYFALVK